MARHEESAGASTFNPPLQQIRREVELLKLSHETTLESEIKHAARLVTRLAHLFNGPYIQIIQPIIEGGYAELRCLTALEYQCAPWTTRVERNAVRPDTRSPPALPLKQQMPSIRRPPAV
jgi:hypothetical protein